MSGTLLDMNQIDESAALTSGHFVQHNLPWLAVVAFLFSVFGVEFLPRTPSLFDDGHRG